MASTIWMAVNFVLYTLQENQDREGKNVSPYNIQSRVPAPFRKKWAEGGWHARLIMYRAQTIAEGVAVALC